MAKKYVRKFVHLDAWTTPGSVPTIIQAPMTQEWCEEFERVAKQVDPEAKLSFEDRDEYTIVTIKTDQLAGVKQAIHQIVIQNACIKRLPKPTP